MEMDANCLRAHSSAKVGGEALDHVLLQERNKELSEQLLKSLNGYRAMKRKYKDAHKKAVHLRKTMDELEDDIGHGHAGLEGLRQLTEVQNGESSRVPEELDALEGLLGNLESKLSDRRDSRKKPNCKG